MPASMLLFFMIVVGIPVIGGIWSKYMRQKMKLRERELDVLGTQTAEKAAQYAAQVERLEQRVRVLERIVTDRGAALAHEIDQLGGAESAPHEIPTRTDH
ncbi:hypothetical protein M2337_000401 [Sphingobium sp. B2D3A]|uniref:hypothetical protein n=1 Tax=Sphingobium TaxID=165695 RepID=UPI0015EC2CD2|nr:MULTISPECIES: hypothetical protein [Sphingobium]MCW2336168.1 hypothetical protein [Sphingobium sp. B2D3A]MCW2363721.1 hypothetical protein [Sphingobium sp. B10D3B]MCW2383544.1 hypothetical protein [Sphingobium sp. B2D3B]MCW2385923.1 hypothetical protein [Sphingobium sp. B2D3D]MCW2399481.1 hypothetical protein [Sphingobium sp. B2D3C]